MNRREFLQLASAASLASMAPGAFATTNSAHKQRTVVLVHLAGGNDGLNTLIPYTDPLYSRLRPNLAIKEKNVLPLENGMGLHPSMKALMPYWNAGEMAWVQGIGYPHPNQSHFRSIDIWDTASSSNEYIEDGWLSQVLPQISQGLHGIVLGQGIGPLAGSKLNAVEMENPKTFLNQAKLIQDIHARTSSNSMKHLLQVQNQLYTTAAELSYKLRRKHPATRRVHFPRTPFGHQMHSIADMINSNVNTPVYKAQLAGFDNHANQAINHKNSLYHLANVLNAFSKSLKLAGKWDDVLLVTYSEFGRRVKENRSGGTDHGMASAHMIMGGKVYGGIYGGKPDLENLDHGNIAYTTDFRSIYGTLANRWWNVDNPWLTHGKIPFV
jgi:uncharacterized protein (DUF1501 family)